MCSAVLSEGSAACPGRSVTWREPQFTDNVKIEHVMTSALPGSDMPLGKHLVIYQVGAAI